jgi:hypothetical protein
MVERAISKQEKRKLCERLLKKPLQVLAPLDGFVVAGRSRPGVGPLSPELTTVVRMSRCHKQAPHRHCRPGGA